MTNIESIREYIKKCPYLEEFNGAVRIGVDYLEGDSTTYSIEKTPSNPILKRFIDGSTIRQETFIFCSREDYGADVLQNIDNSNFYEKFAKWIEEMNDENKLPILESNKESEKIEVTTSGYAFQTDVDKAQYQIQMRLIYMERK